MTGRADDTALPEVCHLLGPAALLLCARLIRPDGAQVVDQFGTAGNQISTCCSALRGEFTPGAAGYKQELRHLAVLDQRRRRRRTELLIQPRVSENVILSEVQDRTETDVLQSFCLKRLPIE